MAELVGQLLLGWLLADLLGGILHWIEDVGLLPDVLDKHIGAPNRQHHADPLSVTKDPSLLRRNWTTWAAAVPIIAASFLLVGLSPLLISAAVGGLVSYEVHRWAHAPRSAPAVVLVLQEIGLFQSPKHHSRHHAPPQDRSYCILSDWLNPVMDAVGFWRALRWLNLRGALNGQR